MHLAFSASFLIHSVPLRAILYMLLSALCFSLVEIAGSHLVRGISAYQLVWGRYAVHLLFMLFVLGPRYKTTLVKTTRLSVQIVRSLTMLVMPVCFILASHAMPAQDIWSIYWLSPLMMLVLSTWVLREPAESKQWIAALAGFGGMLLILQPDRGIFSPSVVLALVVGLAISLHLTLSRVLRDDHPVTSLFHTALWVFASLSFAMPFLWQPPSLNDLIGILLVGLIGALGLFALARSGELVPLPIVASFAYTEAIWTLILNILLFGIVPDKSALLGGLVITGVAGYLLFHQTSAPYAGTEIEGQ